MTSLEDLCSEGNPFLWRFLSEEKRYGVWSTYVNRGGGFINYPEYCDEMDRLLCLT